MNFKETLLWIRTWAGGDMSLQSAFLVCLFLSPISPFSSHSSVCPLLFLCLPLLSLRPLLRQCKTSFYFSSWLSSSVVLWRWWLHWCSVPLSSFSSDFQTIPFFLPLCPQWPLWTTGLFVYNLLHVHICFLSLWSLFIFISPSLAAFFSLPFPSSLCFPLLLIGCVSPQTLLWLYSLCVVVHRWPLSPSAYVGFLFLLCLCCLVIPSYT